MIEFFKKLFGRDAETNKEAGVRVEQIVPTFEPVAEPVVKTVVHAVPKKAVAAKKSTGSKPKSSAKPRQSK